MKKVISALVLIGLLATGCAQSKIAVRQSKDGSLTVTATISGNQSVTPEVKTNLNATLDAKKGTTTDSLTLKDVLEYGNN